MSRQAFVSAFLGTNLRPRSRQASLCSHPDAFPTMSLGAALAAAAAALVLAAPSPAHALFGLGSRRDARPVITMTNQVPTTFSLPSEGGRAPEGRIHKLVNSRVAVAARTAVPALTAVALGVVAVAKILQRVRQKQLRDFQSQLQSFSAMLNLDGVGGDGGAASEMSTAQQAKVILSRGGKKYKFRDAAVETEAELIAAKVRLDLFQGGGAEAGSGAGVEQLVADMDMAAIAEAASALSQTPEDAAKARAARDAALASIKPVVASTPYETAVATSLGAVETGGQTAAVAAEPLDAARTAAGLDVEKAKLAFNVFVSRVVSAQIDKAVVTLGMHNSGEARAIPTEEDAVEGLRHLNGLATTMRAAADIASEGGLVTGLAYVGKLARNERVREDIYRAYAVFCLSDEERVKDDAALQGLLDIQMLLSLSDERAEEVNKEIAKGMFQVAVSSAMTDGSMTPQSKDALEQLKGSFGDFLDGGSADNIISEVAVMRSMHELQKLLAEQGVSQEDVAELRKMCADLGVDVDEMMQNATQMQDSLGPEAMSFVDGLRTLLQDGDASGMVDGIGSMMAKSGVDSNPAAIDADFKIRPAGKKIESSSEPDAASG